MDERGLVPQREEQNRKHSEKLRWQSAENAAGKGSAPLTTCRSERIPSLFTAPLTVLNNGKSALSGTAWPFCLDRNVPNMR